MESLPPSCQRQNMNTVPFVNQPQPSNQAHMCLYVSLRVCVRTHVHVCVCVHAKLRESLGMLAEEKECRTVCVCAHVCGGVIDESRTLPNILCLYICLKVRWHPKGPQHMCMCALVEGEECPARAQLSKHVPVSCLSAPLMEK